MKLLVLCSAYPDNTGDVSLNYVHTRNLYYQNNGIEVDVLNFRTNECYIKDGIKVISLKEYERSMHPKYDILVCHAANLKHHYRFLKRYDSHFSKIVFFYHGHEVMRLKEYPASYSYMKTNILQESVSPIYDFFKLNIYRRYIRRNLKKIELVFVSEWMLDEFIKNLRLPYEKICKHTHVIYNSVSDLYETKRYNYNSPKKYDFITIRPDIDTSKFAIDLVNEIAYNNPNSTFLLVGRGDYFNHHTKAPNIERLEKYLNQKEIIDLLMVSKCALMPTRMDAQGVMACEMATFGIPLITSDIPVCKTVLQGFGNVAYISNNNPQVDLVQLYDRIKEECPQNLKFSQINTIQKEIDLYQSIIND